MFLQRKQESDFVFHALCWSLFSSQRQTNSKQSIIPSAYHCLPTQSRKAADLHETQKLSRGSHHGERVTQTDTHLSALEELGLHPRRQKTTGAPTFLFSSGQPPQIYFCVEDLPADLWGEVKLKGVPFIQATRGEERFTRSDFRYSQAHTGLPDLGAEVNCGLFFSTGRNWEAPCGWRWGRRQGKGSNLGTVINEKSSPHDFLYLVPLASRRLPRGNQKFKLVLWPLREERINMQRVTKRRRSRRQAGSSPPAAFIFDKILFFLKFLQVFNSAKVKGVFVRPFPLSFWPWPRHHATEQPERDRSEQAQEEGLSALGRDPNCSGFGKACDICY